MHKWHILAIQKVVVFRSERSKMAGQASTLDLAAMSGCLQNTTEVVKGIRTLKAIKFSEGVIHSEPLDLKSTREIAWLKKKIWPLNKRQNGHQIKKTHNCSRSLVRKTCRGLEERYLE